MRNSGGGWEDQLTGSLIGLGLLLAMVALVILIWASVQVVHSIVNGFGLTKARSKALWLSLGASVALLVLGLVYHVPTLLIGAGVAFVVLYVCAKAIELSYATLFQREPSRDELLGDIVRVDQWWQA